MSRRPVVEIAAALPADARRAFAAGADRVELCQGLSTGGLTPSAASVAAAIEASDDPARLAALVRPREGGFRYDADEVRLIADEVRRLGTLGLGALVVGALTADRRPDLDAVARWRDAAGATPLVFHRAFDVVDDRAAGLEALVAAGVARVLTSAGGRRCADRLAELAALARQADGRIEILAGGGVRPGDVRALLDAGVAGVHLSAQGGPADGPGDAEAGPGGGPAAYRPVRVHLVAAAVAARDAWARTPR